MRLFSQGRFRAIYIVFAALGTVTGALAMPVVTSSFADAPACPGTTDPMGNCITAGETTINVNIQPVLGLWLSSADFDACSYHDATDGTDTPVGLNSSSATTCPNTVTSSTTQDRTLTFSLLPGGATVTKNMNARVMTNSSTGYQLYIEMASGSTTNALTKAGELRTIAPSATLTSGADLVANTWGVKGGDVTDWMGVPTYNARATTSSAGLLKTGKIIPNSSPTAYGPTTSASAPGGYEDTTITFGAKVDSSFPSGAYTGTVLITAVVTDPE